MPGFASVKVSGLYDVAGGAQALRARLDEICRHVSEATIARLEASMSSLGTAAMASMEARLPWFRRFHGYEMGPLILLKFPLEESSPSLIAAKFVEMIGDGSIWPHVAATAGVTAAGFGLAVLVGVPIGILMGWRARAARAGSTLRRKSCWERSSTAAAR